MTNEALEREVEVLRLKVRAAQADRDRFWDAMCASNRARHSAEIRCGNAERGIDELRRKQPKRIKVVVRHVDGKEIHQLREDNRKLASMNAELHRDIERLEVQVERYRPVVSPKDFVMVVEPFCVTDSDELRVHPSVEQVSRYARLTHV